MTLSLKLGIRKQLKGSQVDFHRLWLKKYQGQNGMLKTVRQRTQAKNVKIVDSIQL